jgi:hypothetical protein
MARAWMASEADYFSKSFDSLAKFDRASCSWKTFLPFGPEGPTLFAHEWPNSGLIVDGLLYPLRKSEPLTSEPDGGAYVPTPTAADSRGSRNITANRSQESKINRHKIGQRGPRMWPTPMARDWKGRGGTNRRSLDLPSAVVEVGGRLNPTWVEWLMGYPQGWTGLRDWGMQWFRPKRGKRS